MRRFELHREGTPNDVLGSGVVAEGVEFSDGAVALRLIKARRMAQYHDVRHMWSIHGYTGLTRLVWVDADGRGDGDG